MDDAKWLDNKMNKQYNTIDNINNFGNFKGVFGW